MRQWVVHVRVTEVHLAVVVVAHLRQPIIRALPVMKDIQRAAIVVYRHNATAVVQQVRMIAVTVAENPKDGLWEPIVTYQVHSSARNVRPSLVPVVIRTVM